MSFDDPGLLWLALALPAAVALAVWLWARRRRRAAHALGSAALLERLGTGDLHRFPTLRLVLVASAAAALGIAASGPRWGLESVEERSSAADLVLALDVSKSMLATDLRPNRLERERVLARRLLRELAGDRIGLVAFAGRAYVLSPMTVDHGALQLYLDALDPDIVSQGGSSLAAAVRQGTDLARGPQDAGRGAVVLVTDGEALEEEDAVLAAADRAARVGITIHTVGVGTESGSPIPETDPGAAGAGGYKRGPDGEIVVSRLNEGLMRAVASRTGGEYVRLGEAGATDAVVAALRGLDRTEGDAQRSVREKARYGWFVLLALLLLAVDGVVAGGRGRPGDRMVAGGTEEVAVA
ncbi:MAG TPA: VWA domain-containing protein [Longimicrobiales bacterium]|nr:VWA domain-containing protein [Longimicrobiales bacterium]